MTVATPSSHNTHSFLQVSGMSYRLVTSRRYQNFYVSQECLTDLWNVGMSYRLVECLKSRMAYRLVELSLIHI